MNNEKIFSDQLNEHKNLFLEIDKYESVILEAGQLICSSLSGGNKLLVCGNGGSAADAQHFSAELIGRFEKERKALPAIALTTDTSIITALSNDYSYDTVFSRQVEALGEEGDIFVGISTSGNSRNILAANEAAQKKGLKTIGLLGRDGGLLSSQMDISVVISHKNTARIQESHIFIIHFWASLIEKSLFSIDH